MIAQHTGARSHSGVIGNEHSAFAGGDLLVGIKRESSDIPQRSNFAPVVLRAERFAGVLDQPQTKTPRDFQEFLHGRRNTESVHDDHGAGSRGNGRLHGGRCQVQGALMDIHKNGNGSDEANGIGHSDKCEGGNDHFIAGLHAGDQQSQMQGRGAGTDGYAMRAVRITCELGLELH